MTTEDRKYRRIFTSIQKAVSLDSIKSTDDAAMVAASLLSIASSIIVGANGGREADMDAVARVGSSAMNNEAARLAKKEA